MRRTQGTNVNASQTNDEQLDKQESSADKNLQENF